MIHGKTRSFFEDFIIVVIIGVIGYVVYGFLMGDFFETEKKNESVTKTETPIQKVVTQKTQTKKELAIKIKTPIQESLVATKEHNTTLQTKPKKLEKEHTEATKKSVDLKLLREFIISTSFTIKQNIDFGADLNNTLDQSFKMRVTVLKSGEYEQLTFVEGNKKLFEYNKNNILKLFPLDIDEKIRDEFPRYLRLRIAK